METGENSHTLRAPASTENAVGIADMLAIIRKRWIYGALAGAAMAGLFVFAMLSKEKVYQSEASLTVEFSTANVMDFREVMDTNVTHVNLLNTMMKTHVERIQTGPVADLVVDSLEPEEVDAVIAPYYDPSGVDSKPPNPVSLIMSRMLEVTRGAEEDSQVIHIMISHPDPVVAQMLADAYVQQYITYKSNLRTTTTGEAVSFLGQQVADMRAELEAEEESLQDYRQKNNLVSVQQDQGIIGERLSRINDALTDARIRLLEVESRQKQIKAAGGEIERLMEIPFFGDREDLNEIYNQLNELKRERKVLDETYLSRHPEILENEASIQSVSEVLQRSVNKVKQQAMNEYESAKAELETLQTNLQKTEREVLDMERAMVEYNRRIRELEKRREIYDRLATRYQETSIASKLNLNNVRPLEPANLPRQPMALSLPQMVAIAVFIGGIFFVGVPLAIELLDNRLSSFRDIENGLGKGLLGDVRYFGKKTKEELSSAVRRKDSDLVEPFRGIYSGIRLRSSLSGKHTSFVVTSSIPGEGKSMIVSNLATLFSKHDFRVLIVDCDLRRPAQHMAFGLGNEKGLIPWFEAGAQDDESTDAMQNADLGIHQISDSLSVLCSGGATELPTEILGDRRVGRLFERLRQQFDVIFFDTPPVGVFPDATMVADHADKCVFVAQQFSVSRSKLRYAVTTMDRSSAPVVGVVLNGIKDVNAAIGYGNKANSYYSLGYEKDPTKYKAYYSGATSG